MCAQKIETKRHAMTEKPIFSLLLRFAIPTTVAMVVTALYTLADSLFVSRLGTEAGAAVGVSFAIQASLQTVGYTLGIGAGSMISRSLGKQDQEKAEICGRVAIYASVAVGTVMGICGLIWASPILRFLGATETILPYALSYSRLLFWAAPFTCTAFVLSQLLRAEGRVIYSMIGLTVGSLCNICLDYVFIAHYKLGIAGASLSTLISQILSCMVLISAYFGKHKHLNLIKRLKVQELSVLLPILGNGLPSALRQGLTTLATILLNRAAGMWSDQAVAAISVVNRLFLLAFAFCLGVGQGMMPIVGYLYGSNHLPRARATYRKAVVLSTLTMAFLALPIWIWARPLMMLFRREEGVLAIGVPALRAQTLVLALHGLMTCTIMALQAIGKKLPATFLASARQGLFFLPLIYLIPLWFGVERVIYVQPVSDVLSFLLTIPFFFYTKQMAENPKKKNTG